MQPPVSEIRLRSTHVRQGGLPSKIPTGPDACAI